MSTATPGTEEEEDRRPCHGIRHDLKECLVNSKCVTVYHKTPRECLRAKDHTAPLECKPLQVAFFECKRSLLDNRVRFRGRKGA